jgi:L-threonylcarbamoyladenylate synthase
VAATAEILPTHTPALFRTAVARAVELLKAGELVALPTETVYGLAANAFEAAAVARIYEAKGRPAHNPIIVHVATPELARRCVAAWPDVAARLARAFWPGPLTLVLPRSAEIPDVVTAGGPTVGVRWPAHPFMQEVIRACGFPLAAPSANRANELSPTCAEHVRKSLGDRVRLIVDGGPCQVGIESTVLDLTTSPPQVLRPGMIHEESLRAAAGMEVREPVVPGQCITGAAEPARSPGQLPKHYSPRARLAVLQWENDADLRRQLARRPGFRDEAAGCVLAHAHIPSPEGFARVSVIPHDPEAFARALYAELHRCDDLGAAWVVIEALPDGPEWRGIADRLARASA